MPSLQQVLMFFAKTLTTGAEVLCIFGPLPARRGAELKVMSSVEHKHNGYCLNENKELRKLERALGDDDLLYASSELREDREFVLERTRRSRVAR